MGPQHHTMGRKDLLRQSVKGSPIVPNSDELREHLKWSSEPPYDGFPSSPNDYKTGARRPQIGGAYLSDVDEYRPKIPVDDKKRVGPTKLDAVPSRMSSSQASTIAIHTFPTDTLKKTKSRIAQKKAASRGSLSPGSKASHMNSPLLSSRQHDKASPRMNTDMSDATSDEKTPSSSSDGKGYTCVGKDSEEQSHDGGAQLGRKDQGMSRDN